MCECVLCLVTQSCLTLCSPVDCSPPGFSVHGILQARILEWFAMPSSRGSSQPRDQTWVSHIAGGFFTIWDTVKPFMCVCVCVCVCMFINYLQESIASFPKGLSVFFLEISRSVCTAWQPHSLEHRQPCTLVVSCSSTWVTARMTSGYSSEVPEMNRVWPSSS